MTTFLRPFQRANRGVTLIEILLALAIIALISSLMLSAFGEYRARQGKSAAAEGVLSILAEARLDTISSKHDDVYGVLLRSDEAIYFKGATYPGDGDPANIVFPMPVGVEIGSVALQGGGSTILYQRLSGSTDMYGTFEVRVAAQPNLKTVITVHPTGASSI